LTVKTYKSGGDGFFEDSECNDTATVKVTEPPIAQCPYTSTESKTSKSDPISWQDNIEIDKDASFRIASFHNNLSSYATDTQLSLIDPNGSTAFTCDGNASECNNKLVTAGIVGTYVLIVKTYTTDRSGFYPEAACND